MIVLQRHSNTFQYSSTPPIEIDLWSLDETEPDDLHVPKTLSLDSISPASFLGKTKFLPCPLLHICPCSSHSPSYYPVPLHKSLRLFFLMLVHMLVLITLAYLICKCSLRLFPSNTLHPCTPPSKTPSWVDTSPLIPSSSLNSFAKHPAVNNPPLQKKHRHHTITKLFFPFHSDLIIAIFEIKSSATNIYTRPQQSILFITMWTKIVSLTSTMLQETLTEASGILNEALGGLAFFKVSLSVLINIQDMITK